MATGVMERIYDDATTKAVYDALLDRVEAAGEHGVEIEQASLHFTRGRAFLGVHPRAGGLLLELVTREPLDGPRVRRHEQVARDRWHNEVLVTARDQVDDELGGWIEQAHREAAR
jgi:hypothetical protein